MNSDFFKNPTYSKKKTFIRKTTLNLCQAMSLRNNLLRYFFKIEIDLKQSLKLNDNKKNKFNARNNIISDLSLLLLLYIYKFSSVHL